MSRLRQWLWPLVLVAFAVSIYLARVNWEMVDFEVYRTAAQRVVEGETLYRAEDGHYQFKYLPAFAVAMYPFGLGEDRVARLIWFALSFGLAVAYVRLSARSVPSRRLSETALVACAILFVGKYYVRELNLGQSNILFAIVVLGALIAAERGQQVLAGVMVALGVFVKPYALILVPWLWLTAGLNGLTALSATFLVGLLLPAAFFGWSKNILELRAWLDTVTTTSAPNLFVPENISFATTWAKLFSLDAKTAFRYGQLTSVVALAFAALVISRRRGVREPAYLEFGFLLALVPLISPQGWDYVLLIATPAFLILCDRWKEMTLVWRALAVISIATISFTIFDLVRRTIYVFAMEHNLITIATVLMLVCLANLRMRKLA